MAGREFRAQIIVGEGTGSLCSGRLREDNAQQRRKGYRVCRFFFHCVTPFQSGGKPAVKQNRLVCLDLSLQGF